MATTIEFEGGANFITARDSGGQVLIRCNTQYTDLGDTESLIAFTDRHGGNDSTASYLQAAYRGATT